MGVEVVRSDMAHVSVDKVTEVDKSFLLDKENGKLDKDPVHLEPIKFGSPGEELDKGEENKAFDANFPKDAVDEWPEPKKIRSFYFARYRPYDDPKIKAIIDQANKEVQKWVQARIQLADELKVLRLERSDLLSQVKALNIDFDQFKAILGEKKKEIEPLQQALGKLRNNNNAGGRGGICSSEEELNDVIYSLQYRIQHESIPLSEEKQLLREIKQLEGTRKEVIANAAMKAKIEDSLGQKDAIQDQVKLMGNDLDGVRKKQQAVWSKKNQIKEKVKAIEGKINSLQDELTAVTQKRDKAYKTILEQRKQRDEGNAQFYQSRSLLNDAKVIAARKDIQAIEELQTAEDEKFMALWSGNKAFKDDYLERLLPYLDSRQLSRDGRIRNPDEKPLFVSEEAQAPTETEVIPKPSVRLAKEEVKSSPSPDTKNSKKVQKASETKVKESKSSPENGVVADKDVSGSGKLHKDTSADEEVDAAKLKEIKREEEIAKAKHSMERKKKLAEKAASKAAIRDQKEAEKKLKEREKKAKKKAASSTTTTADPEESTETVAEASESEKVYVNADAPVPAPVSVKDKAQKENNIRYRNRTKGPGAIPKAILKRKKSNNYMMWVAAATAAALVVLVLLGLGYYYLL